jgi:adenylate kinase
MAEFTESRGPNILITGTPGTGKTTTAATASERTGLEHLNIGELVQREGFHEGKDEEYDTYILDEDRLCDAIEPMMERGGFIVDYHTPEIFPEEWFDLILVLRADTAPLFDRLEERGYNEKKRQENMECEIMQVVLEAVRENFDSEMIHELSSNTPEDMDGNVERIMQWLAMWKQQRENK